MRSQDPPTRRCPLPLSLLGDPTLSWCGVGGGHEHGAGNFLHHRFPPACDRARGVGVQTGSKPVRTRHRGTTIQEGERIHARMWKPFEHPPALTRSPLTRQVEAHKLQSILQLASERQDMALD